MGGDYHFDGDANGKTFSSDSLYYFDLSGNTDLQAESIISSSSLNKISVPFDTTSGLENQTHNQGGALFQTLDSFYVYAGLGDTSTTENNVLAMYNTTSNQWSSHTVSGGNYNKLNRLFPGAASIPSTGLSFFSGGGSSGVSQPGQPTGMLRFDASNPDALTWRNETAQSSSGVSVPARVGGNMVYVPMGEQGVILLWGGYNGTEVNSTTGAPAFTYQLIDNQRIYVYDIASASWNIVWAQGDSIPGRRSETCSVVSAAPDYSSFNIAMYGGWDLYGGEFLGLDQEVQKPMLMAFPQTRHSRRRGFSACPAFGGSRWTARTTLDPTRRRSRGISAAATSTTARCTTTRR